jgi:hypothetical protein
MTTVMYTNVTMDQYLQLQCLFGRNIHNSQPLPAMRQTQATSKTIPSWGGWDLRTSETEAQQAFQSNVLRRHQA